ncbi:nucleotidyltransferase family protein [Erythrobacter sp. SDW2]|uniref:nucleotidyltransferase family protein n=1 Tax=Erythrobacter sp. SDW2 TaxID=2907154 RepID=UPI001F1AB74C|nr:nucleotidyltransferase family protein [Erythrobacter sp. SDW2]UIP07648.1 nucleotidyltransferase family protein [Erythrobacter sp. SDW2]
MASLQPVAVAVLAAGQSRRFGADDKLAAQFRGTMLGLHACRTLSLLPFAQRWVIASDARHPCGKGWREAGFTVVPNPHAGTGMGSSVALAAKLAQDAGVTALLIALADMPLVPASHFADLLEHARPDALVTSHNGTSPTPPALFGSAHFPQLKEATGDTGARALVSGAEALTCESEWLVDIDDPSALARYS